MCCNAHSKADTANEDPSSTHVEETLVATPLPDGYWLHAFPFDNNSDYPDLIGYGLGFLNKSAAIKLLINPKNSGASGWKLTEIQKLDFPVSMGYADLTGNGLNDVIICDRYGPSMDALWDAKTENGGRLQWLRNPGDRDAQPYWTEHHIGNSTGMHRQPPLNLCSYLVGHFTQTERIQVMGLPVISRSGDRTSPTPILVYTPIYGSNVSEGPQSWEEEIPFPSQFRIIHDAKLVPGSTSGLDMVLVAGREGTALLWFNKSSNQWEHRIVGAGLPREGTDNPYWGSGSVDFVRVENDPVGYITTCEAFHGNHVAVYTKPLNAAKGADSLKENIWTRRVIDDFGPLNSAHTGTIHHVNTIPNPTGASDSFGIACMGAPANKPENQGVYMYTATDLLNGEFKRQKLTQESAARLAVSSFTEAGKTEIASISYYVPDYHTGPDPPGVRINSIEPYNTASRTRISATKLNKEVLLRVPRPGVVPEGVVPTMPLLTIAGKKNTLVVLRPGQLIKLAPSAGAKVIYGTIEMTTPYGEVVTRTIAPPVKDKATTHPLSKNGTVAAGTDGAVIVLVEEVEGAFQGPYRAMDEITTTNMFAHVPHVPADVKAMEFPFIKVEDLAWGDKDGEGLWNDFEFYNMTGFHIYFNDDAMEEICHMQAWTLGLGETARFHNHSDRSFCEIHYCLSNGGGEGSMRYFADDYTDDIDTDAELTKAYVEANSTKLVVPTMYEHGPLWTVVPGTKWTPQLRENDTAKYPWHAWLASEFGDHKLPIIPPLSRERQKFDLWLAFEFPTSAFQE
ncbi:hypothetical protein C8F04DRAFT_1013557 [Mycena alexandri]|uniref:Aldos-2-ulose dehydratase/isomerase (AUDH) Cupin domain-containing protein n=1 Tax=Mycena alexandri TaxID=1745969 RepID=A0AAD6WQ94_9AGAR|nr:hypothetical protein C8F04DRAFT_1013557 [Mycena alexandri]